MVSFEAFSPPNFLIFVQDDFRDALCVAEGAFGRSCVEIRTLKMHVIRSPDIHRYKIWP